jgi:hypothetical protein
MAQKICVCRTTVAGDHTLGASGPQLLCTVRFEREVDHGDETKKHVLLPPPSPPSSLLLSAEGEGEEGICEKNGSFSTFPIFVPSLSGQMFDI